jgi:TatD DNase family protein
MLIDTHAHLQDPRYDDLDAVLARAGNVGVMAAIVPGTDVDDSRVAVALAERYTGSPCALYAAVGIHPTGADALTPSALAELRDLACHPRVVAIGEIGLDYYWPNVQHRKWPCAEPAQQCAALEAQLALAEDMHLPVIIHDRDAHDDTLRILRAWVRGNPTNTGTLHAYAGGPARLSEALDLGFYIGMDGPVTFDKAAGLHDVARLVPQDRLLIETDAPYLTPHPHRGQRNEPAYVTYVAQRIAELKDITVGDVATATIANARRLFRITQ